MANIKDFTLKSAIGLIVALGGYWGAEKIHKTDAERAEEQEIKKIEGQRQQVFRAAHSYLNATIDSMIAVRGGLYYSADVPALTREFNKKFSNELFTTTALVSRYNHNGQKLTHIKVEMNVTDKLGVEKSDTRIISINGEYQPTSQPSP